MSEFGIGTVGRSVVEAMDNATELSQRKRCGCGSDLFVQTWHLRQDGTLGLFLRGERQIHKCAMCGNLFIEATPSAGSEP